MIGNGKDTLFWEDRWLDGRRVEELAPTIYTHVNNRVRSTRTVTQALLGAAWARDVGPEVTTQVLNEYLTLWM